MNKREVTFPAVVGKSGEGTFRCGFRSYEELVDYLDKIRDCSKLDMDALKLIGGWGSCHEASCEHSKRHFIADYLLYVAREFKGDKRRHVERAGRAISKSRMSLRELVYYKPIHHTLGWAGIQPPSVLRIE